MFYCIYIAVKFVTDGQAGNSHVSDQWQDRGLADSSISELEKPFEAFKCYSSLCEWICAF